MEVVYFDVSQDTAINCLLVLHQIDNNQVNHFLLSLESGEVATPLTIAKLFSIDNAIDGGNFGDIDSLLRSPRCPEILRYVSSSGWVTIYRSLTNCSSLTKPAVKGVRTTNEHGQTHNVRISSQDYSFINHPVNG